MLTKREVERLAKKWLNTMPRGWKSRVWENMGWHFDLNNGPISIHYDEHVKSDLRFSAMIADYNQVQEMMDGKRESCHGGSCLWIDRKYKKFRTPQEAAKRAFEVMYDAITEEIRQFNVVLDLSREAIKDFK